MLTADRRRKKPREVHRPYERSTASTASPTSYETSGGQIHARGNAQMLAFAMDTSAFAVTQVKGSTAE